MTSEQKEAYRRMLEFDRAFLSGAHTICEEYAGSEQEEEDLLAMANLGMELVAKIRELHAANTRGEVVIKTAERWDDLPDQLYALAGIES